MISIKSGVELRGLRPEMSVAVPMVASCFHKLGRECVITSVCEGQHSRNSLHYKGMAVDFRTRHLSVQEKEQIVDLVRQALTVEFDVVLESTHLHVEWDPHG